MYLGNIIKIVSYAYVAEIITEQPIFSKERGKWFVICDLIWDKNGIPVREKYRILEFASKKEAEAIDIGIRVDESIEYKWEK